MSVNDFVAARIVRCVGRRSWCGRLQNTRGLCFRLNDLIQKFGAWRQVDSLSLRDIRNSGHLIRRNRHHADQREKCNRRGQRQASRKGPGPVRLRDGNDVRVMNFLRDAFRFVFRFQLQRKLAQLVDVGLCFRRFSESLFPFPIFSAPESSPSA